MLTTTAYILISIIIIDGNISQTTTTFADKLSCESAATRQAFVYKNMHFDFAGKWNVTCHPYSLSEDKK